MKNVLLWIILCLIFNNGYAQGYGLFIEHLHSIKTSEPHVNWTSIYATTVGYEGFGEIWVAADGTKSSKITFINQANPSNCDFVTPVFLDGPYGYDIDTTYDPITDGEILDFNCVNGTGSFIYKHPEEYANLSMYNNSLPTIGILNGNGYLIGKITVNPFKIPVLLIHGLWADANSFKGMKTYLTNQFNVLTGQPYYYDATVRIMDYSNSHQQAFASNYPKVQYEIKDLIDACVNETISVGKVNIVAHSMGGILSRLHIANNYKYILNRLITCNTPHSGSQMANLLINESPQLCNLVSKLSNINNNQCGTLNDAIKDLQVNSQAIANLNTSNHPPLIGVHAIITHENVSIQTVYSSVDTYLATSYAQYAVPCVINNAFNNDDNDLVVADESQRGGLGPYYTTTITGQMHVGSTDNINVKNEVWSLLQEPEFGSTKFNVFGFNPPTLSYTPTPSFCNPAPRFSEDSVLDAAATNPNASIQITGPIANTNYNCGETIFINYSATDIDTVIASFAYKNDSVVVYREAVPASGNGTIALPIPQNSLLGNRTIGIAGLDNIGIYSITDISNVNINTNANLVGLSLGPFTSLLEMDDEDVIQIEGTYDDGTIRDLSNQDGFQYNFYFGNADTAGINMVEMINTGNDELYISMNGITSNTIYFNYLPPCTNQDNTWQGPTSGSHWYQSEQNWSLGRVPSVCDHVIIPTGNELSVNAGDIGFGYTLSVEGTASLDVPLGAEIDIKGK